MNAKGPGFAGALRCLASHAPRGDGYSPRPEGGSYSTVIGAIMPSEKCGAPSAFGTKQSQA